jgi:protein-S-isoprenylcysteine O-methyltransferase Ste14
MPLVYRYLFPTLWLGWAAYWWALSRRVKIAVRREPLPSRLLHIGPLLLAALLLSVPGRSLPVLGERLLPQGAWPFWAGSALTAGGLLFAVWARRQLGGNWSGTVTIKQDHELITSGPYGIVRHPIYTGLLLAFAGSALARGDGCGVLALMLAFWALWRKLRLEERWLRDEFGDSFQVYRRRVAALVPFLL